MDRIQTTIKERLPIPLRRFLKTYFFELAKYYFCLRSFINQYLFKNFLIKNKKQLHLGCGDIRMENFINMDYRATPAVDLIHDCTDLSLFAPYSFKTIYAHAFFEHIYRDKQLLLLAEIRRILEFDGKLIILGIPDFEEIARSYLEKRPGIVGGKFDLFNVYRYTHGDPEQYPKWWLEQLHKGLFDKEELKRLLKKSGFKNFLIFRYRFGNEKIPLNLGLVAIKSEKSSDLKIGEVKKMVSKLNPKIDKKSLRIL